MAIDRHRYSKEEFARKGNEIYELHIRPEVEAANKGKVVAIDIDSGTYELAENAMAASKELLKKKPDAQIWRVRVGHKGVHRFGLGRSL